MEKENKKNGGLVFSEVLKVWEVFGMKAKKILFFGAQLAWPVILEKLIAKQGAVFFDQAVIQQILASLNDGQKQIPGRLFLDDYSMYGRAGSYHGYLLFLENQVVFIVDVYTTGPNKFTAQVSQFQDFASGHPNYNAPHGKDCPDFFVIPAQD